MHVYVVPRNRVDYAFEWLRMFPNLYYLTYTCDDLTE